MGGPGYLTRPTPRAWWLVVVLVPALVAACVSKHRPAAAAPATAAPLTAAATTTPGATTTLVVTTPATTVATTTVATTTAPATVTAPTTIPVGTVPADMLNPAVTPATISVTICVTGYTTTIRPPTSYTEPLKVHQIISYHYADPRVGDYEEDHVIALEIGGSPAAAVNLFPEPHSVSYTDDTLENTLHRQVCGGQLSLAAAQRQLFAAKVAHGYSRAASASASGSGA